MPWSDRPVSGPSLEDDQATKPVSRQMEGERGEEQQAYIQAHIRLPPGQVHQSQSKGLGFEAAETSDESRMLRAAKTNKTRG
jgi:hypothetical protein